MSIPDAAVAHVVPVPDPAHAAFLLEQIERGGVPGEDAAAIAGRLVGILFGSLIPNGTDEPLAWKGPRASGIYRCERAQVLEAKIAHLPREYDAKSILTLQTGHFMHAMMQARFPDVPSEEEWRSPWMGGHSDQRWPTPPGVMDDYKTINGDGYVKVVTSGRPKNEHIVQASWYAIRAKEAGHPCHFGRIVYLNKNGSIPKSSKDAWKKFAAHYKTTYGTEPSPILHVLRFEACPKIAAAADAKAKRIRDYVAAGTVPDCKEAGICWDCREVDAAIAKLADQPFPDDVAETPQFQEWEAADPLGRLVRWSRWPSKIVGRTFRGIDDQAVLGLLKPGHRMRLEWDWQNPHGPRLPSGHAAAIKVIHETTNTWLGFLPARQSPTAAKVALILKSGGQAWAEVAELTGGTPDKPSVGINLYITGTNIPVTSA